MSTKYTPDPGIRTKQEWSFVLQMPLVARLSRYRPECLQPTLENTLR